MKTKRVKRKLTRYTGYYIDYRLITHEGKHGFARVGIHFSYQHSGNVANSKVPTVKSGRMFDEREESTRFLSWIENYKKMIRSKKYDLPTNYNNLEVNSKRAVRLQYMKEQGMLCQHCSMSLTEKPAADIESSIIFWEKFPNNFQKHPIHLHHDHKTSMTIGAVHMKCNAHLWQYKGE